MDPVVLARPPWYRRVLTGKGRPFLLAIFSGLLLSLSYPLFDLGWLAWAALLPLYLTFFPQPSFPARMGKEGKRFLWFPAATLLPGFFFGVTLFLVGMFWMNEIGALPWFVLACIQAVAFALLGGICAFLLPRLPLWARPFLFAAVWVLAEWARSQGGLAFPWFMLSSSQVRTPLLVQIVSLTGQWGLSFAVAAVNGCLAESWRAWSAPGQSGRRPAIGFLAGGAAIIAGLIAYGLPASRYYGANAVNEGRTMVVAVAQGSYVKPESYNGDAAGEVVGLYLNLSRDAAVANPAPDLIAWPETTLPFGLLNNRAENEAVTTLARAQRLPMLIGTPYTDPMDNVYNSAALVEADGSISARYDKVQLVPEGEFFPARWLFGSFYARYGVPEKDMTAGTVERAVSVRLRSGYVTRLGPMICYESVFPTHARAQVRDGAQALLLLTSDQTFGVTAGPYQHADQSVIRAVETRRWLVRAASTGVSEFIDPAGRVVASLGLMQRGVLSHTIALRDEKTLFVQWGNWFIALCGLVFAFAAGFVVAQGRQNSVAVNSPSPASASAEASQAS